jgi:2-polyprenyl-3-methyl-5-hydroxy-6-metoxy-1,4-benzoquinol methylase
MLNKSRIEVSVKDIQTELGIRFTRSQESFLQNKQLNKYVYPESDYQISTLLTKLNKPAVYFRLCQLICKFKRSWDFAAYTTDLLRNKKAKDSFIFERLFKDTESKSVTEFSKEYVAEYIINIFNNLHIPKPRSLLDIGCGNCIFTKDLGMAMQIKPADIYGADVAQEFELNWKATRPSDIKFVEIQNNKLRFDRKFDMITSMMVLHHVPEEVLLEYIAEIYKLLNPGGVFVIKEHDCYNAADYMIADLEHSLYIAKEAAVITKNNRLSADSIKKIADQHISYKDRFTWRVLIQREGFKCIYENPYDMGLSNTYAPNRAYLAIFQK